MTNLHQQYLEQRVAQLAFAINELRPRVEQAWGVVRAHRRAAGFDEIAEHDDDQVLGLAPHKAYAASLEARLHELAAAVEVLMGEIEGDEFGAEDGATAL